MRYTFDMHRRRTALFLLFVGIFASWWGVSQFGRLSSLPSTPEQQSAALPLVQYADPSVVMIEHSQEGDLHTYSGSITLPSECSELGSGIAAQGSPLRVTILISITSASPCISATPMSQPFVVSVSAPEEPQFSGITVNGVIIPSHIIER